MLDGLIIFGVIFSVGVIFAGVLGAFMDMLLAMPVVDEMLERMMH